MQNRHGIVARFEHWLWTRQQRDIDEYLAQATDLHDLEARIVALERSPSPLR